MEPIQAEETSGGIDPLKPSKPAGWVWLAVIVIIVAGVLYLTQSRAPQEAEEEVEEEEPQIVVKDVPLTVTLVDAPESVVAGTIFGVEWNVDAPEATAVSHTAVHYDTVAHPGQFDQGVTPDGSGYAKFTKTYASGLYPVPFQFEDNIKVDDDSAGQVLYLRAHATVAGKNYWSEEVMVPIKALGETGSGS